MHILSHISYPYFAANIFAWLFGFNIPLEYNLLLIFFSVFPDFDYVADYVYQKVVKGSYKIPDNHHSLPSHYPIVYTPLIPLAVFTGEPFFIIATSAIFVHLLMDVLFCNEGVMLFYPFSTKWFNFFAKKTAGKPGLEWNKVYSKLIVAKVDRVFFLFVLVHFSSVLLF